MSGARTADEHKQAVARSGGNGRAPQVGADAERGFGHRQPSPPRPARSTAADALLGHVISVAGSVVWGALDPSGTAHAEIGAIDEYPRSQRECPEPAPGLPRDHAPDFECR